jgi:hypothetical protein
VVAVPATKDVRGADLAGLKLSATKMRSIAALADADLDVAHRQRHGDRAGDAAAWNRYAGR